MVHALIIVSFQVSLRKRRCVSGVPVYHTTRLNKSNFIFEVVIDETNLVYFVKRQHLKSFKAFIACNLPNVVFWKGGRGCRVHLMEGGVKSVQNCNLTESIE